MSEYIKPTNFEIKRDTLFSEFLSEGLRINRFDNIDALVLDSRIILTSTFCPLYAPGPLETSTLINEPNRIEDSRVASKWDATVRVFNAARRIAKAQGIGVEGVFTFADLGVISNNGSGVDLEALSYHEHLYRQGITEMIESQGVKCYFQCYSDILPEFPLTIHPGVRDLFASYSQDTTHVARELCGKVTFDNSVINNQTGEINRAGKKIIGSMLKAFGKDLTRDLLIQYGTFDPHTTREGALNVFYERGELLLNVTNLFEHKKHPRLDIVC